MRLAVGLIASLLITSTSLPAASQTDPHQTGTARRMLIGDYDKKILAIVGADGKIEWQVPIRDIHDAQQLGNGNILFQDGWTHLLEMTPDKKVAWEYDAGKMNGNDGKHVEVHAFERLPDGSTMIAESGPGRIIEVDRAGKILHEIKLRVSKADPHRDTRLVRKLDNGHYLVAHEGDATVREYDSGGAVVWEHKVGSAVFSAERLPNGHTLIGAGNGNRVVEVDKEGKEVWTLEKNDLPGVTLAWVTMVDRLENGNTLVVNCHAGPENPQIIEVTPDKKIVWSFKDFDRFGNALPVALVLLEKK